MRQHATLDNLRYEHSIVCSKSHIKTYPANDIHKVPRAWQCNYAMTAGEFGQTVHVLLA